MGQLVHEACHEDTKDGKVRTEVEKEDVRGIFFSVVAPNDENV